jgi:hypothetical protein
VDNIALDEKELNILKELDLSAILIWIECVIGFCCWHGQEAVSVTYQK